MSKVTTEEKAELRKVAESATCCDGEYNYRFVLQRAAFAPVSLLKHIDTARPRLVLALLDENARLLAERIPTCPRCLERVGDDIGVEGPNGNLWHDECLQSWRSDKP